MGQALLFGPFFLICMTNLSMRHIILILFIVLLVPFYGCNNFFKEEQFELLKPNKTAIHFINKPLEKEGLNILYYLYYYNGGGVSIGDINNDGLSDIYFSANAKGENKLYLNKGNFKFEDISQKAGVQGIADWSSGTTMVDINNDGFLDIVVCAVAGKFGLNGHNQVFINNRNNSFSEKSKELGLQFKGLSVQMGFFDYDHDGDLDAYLLNQSYFPHANIIDTSNRNFSDSLSGDLLYRNDLNVSGRFVNVTKEAGIYNSKLGYGLGLAIADLNNDGWDDLYIGNDFHENDYYYVNLHNGTFKESGAKHFKHYSRFSMGNDINDYNNDGQPDIITVDMLPPDEKTLKTYGSDEHMDIYNLKLMGNGFQHQVSRNVLQRNNGNGVSFSDVALMSGIASTDWSWSPLFTDFDNDGNKDLFITSGIVKRPVDLDYIKFVSDLTEKKGMNQTNEYDEEAINAMPDGASHPFFFLNNGFGAFEDKTTSWGLNKAKGYFNGAAYGDLDNDGDVDIVVNSLNSKALVYKNNSNKNNSLTLLLKGNDKNRFGIGAKLYVFNKGQVQYQQLQPTRGFQSSVDYKMNFGVGNEKQIDSIYIVWPSQKIQKIFNLVAGKTIICKEQNATQELGQVNLFNLKKEPLFLQEDKLKWKHQENDFIDNNVQYLIPHFASTRGPKMAVADVNKDGLDDIFLCASKEQPSALFIQQRGGDFKKTNQSIFEINKSAEDVDAVFFDANNDSNIDLLVITGGNQTLRNGREGEDRLYLNDGKGNFKKEELSFLIQYENKSCIDVADVDKDGDIDFFVGNYTKTNAYGEPTNSYLYLNNGNGKFQLATGKQIYLQQLGMVTAAKFADVNNDNWPDLIIVGEWMSVKIFMNNKGKFIEKELPNTTGLWQSLFVTDINKDGHIDFFAGNWGKNSKLFSKKDGPLKLYVKDFDNNNSIEQILTYTIKGKEYPFYAKNELELALPVLKKAYLGYNEVAGKTVQFIFDDLFNNYKELKAELLTSSAFINDGKGKYNRIELPNELQLSPLFSFIPYNSTDNSFLAGGNFYGVSPYEGRYDAQIPTIVSYQNNRFKKVGDIPHANKELRDMKWIKVSNNKHILAISNNNDSVQVYKPIK